MNLLGVYGAGGCGRGVMPLVRDSIGTESGVCELVFVDDAAAGSITNGHRVLTFDQFVSTSAAARHVCLAVSNSRVRETIATRCINAGIGILDVRAANVIVMTDVKIGVGAVLSPFVTLTSNISIGRFFHANLYSYVEHDCVIGDFVTFAPGVHCNGNVHIEDHAYIGSGAVLRQGRPGNPLVIGRGAIVGMGAVVTKSVPAGITVVGNPARPMSKG